MTTQAHNHNKLSIFTKPRVFFDLTSLLPPCALPDHFSSLFFFFSFLLLPWNTAPFVRLLTHSLSLFLACSLVLLCVYACVCSPLCFRRAHLRPFSRSSSFFRPSEFIRLYFCIQHSLSLSPLCSSFFTRVSVCPSYICITFIYDLHISTISPANLFSKLFPTDRLYPPTHLHSFAIQLPPFTTTTTTTTKKQHPSSQLTVSGQRSPLALLTIISLSAYLCDCVLVTLWVNASHLFTLLNVSSISGPSLSLFNSLSKASVWGHHHQFVSAQLDLLVVFCCIQPFEGLSTVSLQSICFYFNCKLSVQLRSVTTWFLFCSKVVRVCVWWQRVSQDLRT